MVLSWGCQLMCPEDLNQYLVYYSRNICSSLNNEVESNGLINSVFFFKIKFVKVSFVLVL